MPLNRTNRESDVNGLTKRLLVREFGDYLMGIWFKGRWEDFDIRLRFLLKEEPPDFHDRLQRVDQELEKKGYFALIGHDVWDELEEDEKQDWQSVWTPVKGDKVKKKAALRRTKPAHAH